MRLRRYLQIISVLTVSMTLLTSCHGSKSVSREESKVEHTVRKPHKDKLTSTVNERIVAEACTWLGTPYKYAGTEKGCGCDCSGLVMRVYEDVAGVKLPRNSAKQAEFCKKIAEKDVVAGDLVFFATGSDSTKVSHVGIMIDELQFVHASSTKGVVISKMSGPYYPSHFIMYGRVPD